MVKATVRQRRLGSQLRDLRERTGMKLKDVSAVLQLAESTVSRMELGERGIRTPDLGALLDAYGVEDGPKRQGLVNLALDAQREDWFNEYEDVLGSAFRNYLSLEIEATSIRYYQPQCVPGLLQVEAYARAVLALGPRDAEGFERMLQVRMGRQSVLDRAQPPKVSVILDEQVIRRPLGGRRVLHNQLRHLVGAARRPNVEVQIIPQDIEKGLVITGGAVAILSFPEADADAVFLEDMVDGSYMEAPDAIHTYGVAFDRLRDVALDPDASVELIARAAEELERHD